MKGKIRVSCQKENLKTIRKFVSDHLEGIDFSISEKNLITLAIDEVCTNLMVHSHNCDPNNFIEITCQRKSHSFICEIYDWGIPFNILEYQTPELEEIIRKRRNGGMGLILVKKIMDKIEMTTENNYNVYTFSKYLNPADTAAKSDL